ncbi:MAG TPA: hypothetical protein VM598_08775 [Bdellovibrionota bacterium]|nr:hypothetical protein [Bdellovibrionota bacterium]
MGKLDWSRKDSQDLELDRDYSVPALEISLQIERRPRVPGRPPSQRLLGSALFRSNQVLLPLEGQVELVRGHELAGHKHAARSGRRSRKKGLKSRKGRSNLAKKALIFLVAVLIGVHAGDWRPILGQWTQARGELVGPAPAVALPRRL